MMNFDVSSFALSENKWYNAIQENVDKKDDVWLETNQSRYKYKLTPRYPSFYCRTYDGEREIDVQIRMFFKRDQLVMTQRGRIGVVTDAMPDPGDTRVDWLGRRQARRITSKSLIALKSVSAALVCNATFNECRRNKMQITLCTTRLNSGRRNVYWLVIIQRTGSTFKWIRLANLEPMEDQSFEYWWATPSNTGWKLLRPAVYVYMHDLWETRILKDTFHNPRLFPAGRIEDFSKEAANELRVEFPYGRLEQKTILHAIQAMFEKRGQLKPGATEPIPISFRK